MTSTQIWVVLILAGAGTYLTRLSLLAALGGDTVLSPVVQRALRLVPAAVLTALVTPALLRVGGDWDIWNARLAAGALAAAVAWRTRSVIGTLAVGMVILWVLQAL